MTKNVVLGAIAALVLGTTAAAAADLPMKTKAPPPIAIYDWTGFYIGVSGGGSLGQSTHIDQATGLGDTIGYNVKGGLVGGTVGYNWQVSSVVFGFEGDASWVGEYGSNIDDGLAGNPAFTSFTKETWLGTARGRLGYAVNNLLFYGTGGYAVAGVTAGVKDSATAVLYDSSSSTRNGWTAGGGLEWGFLPNWSAKFEWLYMKFESKPLITVNLGPGFNRSSVPLDDNVVRAGINYRFGGPVVARY
jgi:outer membrane immunogenic protein